MRVNVNLMQRNSNSNSNRIGRFERIIELASNYKKTHNNLAKYFFAFFSALIDDLQAVFLTMTAWLIESMDMTWSCADH